VIRIPDDLLQQIRAQGAEAYPEECCGVLLGQADHGSKVVHTARRFENRSAESRERRYYVGPDAYREAEAWARSRGLDVVGIYHSHPDHPARPSEYDREHAWPWYSYLIVSVERGQPSDLTSWVLAEERDRFDAEEVECT
jgi:proteasome lid subunit RPN8/RPN11